MILKTVFALLYKAGYCVDFNWEAYKSDIWYYYFPRGMYQAGILYIIAGLFVPIVVQMLYSQIRSMKHFHDMLKKRSR